MNVADVVTRVKRQFGDESAVQILDTDIVNWINDAQMNIVSANEELLQTTSTISLVANQQDYAIPADCLSLFSASVKLTGQLSFLPLKFAGIQQFNELINAWDGTALGTGNPTIYTVYANLIRLIPIPGAASTNGLKIFYNRSPVVLAAPAGALDLPVQYHSAIVNYCLQQAFEMDENFEASLVKEGQVQASIKDNRHNDNKNPSETYGRITVLPDDSW